MMKTSKSVIPELQGIVTNRGLMEYPEPSLPIPPNDGGKKYRVFK